MAVEVRKVDLASKRAALAETLSDLAAEWAEQTRQPCLVFNFGGKDNTYSERTIPRPTTGDIRNLAQAINIAVQRGDALAPTDVAETEKGLLAQLGEALGLTPPPGDV